MFTGDLLLELSRALEIKDGARLEVVKDKGLPLKKELFGRERVEAKDREAWLGEGRGVVGRRVVEVSQLLRDWIGRKAYTYIPRGAKDP